VHPAGGDAEAPATREDTHVVVDVGTELSAATAAALRAAVADGMRQGRTIHLQLGSVVSYDAAGLGLLVGLRRRIEGAGGRLICVDPSAAVYAGIRKLGFHRVLDIRLDLPEQPSAAPATGPSDGAPSGALDG
jgi:anti-anti-sigma factor